MQRAVSVVRLALSIIGRSQQKQCIMFYNTVVLVSDVATAPGIEIGRNSETFRRIRIKSGFGLITVFVTDGHLPYPYGREITGYEVPNLDETIAKARAAGVSVLSGPYSSDGRSEALVQFPGGYIAEIHSLQKPNR